MTPAKLNACPFPPKLREPLPPCEQVHSPETCGTLTPDDCIGQKMSCGLYVRVRGACTSAWALQVADHLVSANGQGRCSGSRALGCSGTGLARVLSFFCLGPGRGLYFRSMILYRSGEGGGGADWAGGGWDPG
jgi:hypothetical protein